MTPDESYQKARDSETDRRFKVYEDDSASTKELWQYRKNEFLDGSDFGREYTHNEYAAKLAEKDQIIEKLKAVMESIGNDQNIPGYMRFPLNQTLAELEKMKGVEG